MRKGGWIPDHKKECQQYIRPARHPSSVTMWKETLGDAKVLEGLWVKGQSHNHTDELQATKPKRTRWDKVANFGCTVWCRTITGTTWRQSIQKKTEMR